MTLQTIKCYSIKTHKRAIECNYRVKIIFPAWLSHKNELKKVKAIYIIHIHFLDMICSLKYSTGWISFLCCVFYAHKKY